ncbi:hypothetical protein [Methyloceanibacter sp.]|uniref:hypothetical protein n=1 Tax=Methyloceanibacter sp. TaxID=1965321 RepID=UPI003562204F
MFLRSAYCLMVLLPALLLGGCAGSMPDTSRLKRFTDVIRGYDETLTPAEKEAAISELQKDKERQDEQTGKSEDAPKTN